MPISREDCFVGDPPYAAADQVSVEPETPALPKHSQVGVLSDEVVRTCAIIPQDATSYKPMCEEASISKEASPVCQVFSNFKFDETVSATFYGRREVTIAGTIAFVLASVYSFGFVYLFARWLPRLRASLTTRASPLESATHVLVENSFGQIEIVPVVTIKVPLGDDKQTFDDYFIFRNGGFGFARSFRYRCSRFVLERASGTFVSAHDLLSLCLPPAETNTCGTSTAAVAQERALLGGNVIEIERKGVFDIFFSEVLHPFNVFQIVSFVIWCFEKYYAYAIVLMLMTVAAIINTVYETRVNMEKMCRMTRFECFVRLLRNNAFVECSSVDIVPGDVVVLDENIEIVPCDGVLLNGDAIVDEAMLTGETLPITKTDIHDDAYEHMMHSGEEDGRFVLYSGTRLLRSRPRHGRPALLLATRTGFFTTKGSLVQSILFPRPNNFRFYSDSITFIKIMAAIAAVGFIFALFNFIKLGVEWSLIIQRAADVITVVVPPALPALMTNSTMSAIRRLEKLMIYCISPPRINVASSIDTMCFDKTGTLTEDGLEMLGVLPVVRSVKGAAQHEIGCSVDAFVEPVFAAKPIESMDNMSVLTDENALHALRLMASCHSLSRINGRLLGDSLDLHMLQFTQWTMEEPDDNDEEALVPTVMCPPAGMPGAASQRLGVMRQFDFVSRLRRMSVIVRPMDAESGADTGALTVYCKGSPETLFEICNPASLPPDYHTLLAHYAHNGYRVIACAYKQIPNTSWLRVQRMSRADVECDLVFLGFLIFENRLKPATEAIIQQLQVASISCIMATGDNILTAISVARASGLISEHSRVFYPDSYDADSRNVAQVRWRCVDDRDTVSFDPVRLLPAVDDFTGRNDAPIVLAVTGTFFDWVIECAGTLYIEGEEREVYVCDCPSDMSASADIPALSALADCADRCAHVTLSQREMDSYLVDLLRKCAIYARMSPHQKQLLVEMLQKGGRTVGFCGDGANDCGALKAADVGISLSQAEASVAAPFTSLVQDISCVPLLLKEGRCSLVTSFACFKYMTLYSMVQFVTLIGLYKFGSTMSDYQFIFVDLALIMPLGYFMSCYGPAQNLTRKMPTTRLISPGMLSSILGHILLQGIFQVIVYVFIASPAAVGFDFDPHDEERVEHPITTLMFLFSAALYIATAVVFCEGAPYREKVQKPFVGIVLLGIVTTLLVQFACPPFLADFLQMVDTAFTDRLMLVPVALVYLVLAIVLERWVAPFIGRSWVAVLAGRTPGDAVPAPRPPEMCKSIVSHASAAHNISMPSRPASAPPGVPRNA